MTREPIPAALLRALLSAGEADLSRTCEAEQSRMGWMLVYGGFVLRSQRIPGPRYFQTLESLVRVAAALGFNIVKVVVPELVGESDQAQAKSKPKAKRGRKAA